uniref:Rho termination factor-like N-terminal domain-containing protein n=1 Tax=Rhizophora mucronata TaxID=61149 RepID=A0A2P2JR51_RHIMU
MSQAVHLIAKNVPGYGLPEGRFLPHPRTSGRAVASFSSCGERRTYSQVMMGSMKGPFIATSFSCKASSGRQRRNADFSRQNKHVFSRNRNRQNELRESFENVDEYDLLSSKNGPLLSLSNPQKSQATAVPGQKEKEIVELFRKVQAQLRERAAAKEDNKVEASQEKGKQSETVDSLLKLLRKHSIDQGKKKTRQASGQDNDLGQNVPYADDKSKNFGNLNDRARNDVLDPSSFSPTRPQSNFQRKSPIPQVKMQPIYVTDDPVNSTSQLKLNGDKRQQFERCPDPADLDKSGQAEAPELKMEPGSSFVDDNLFDELSENESLEDDNVEEDSGEESLNEQGDFSSLKLSELRTLAKSHGIKGFSKMKKADLVELLNGSSV